MSSSRVEAEMEWFSEALDQPAAERRAFIDRRHSGSPDVADRLHRLLDAHESAAAERTPNFAATEAILPRTPGGHTHPERIGPYTISGVIGEGGMGVVYAARQAVPVRRSVAIKVIKPGMDSREVIRRFDTERQALATMDHPCIARMLDAGMTEEQRPYFVMELIKGLPITAFCSTHDIPPAERLRLFMEACDAVQHAHQKGIIHRDLKPTNLLVRYHDGVPRCTVIDFGVAKAVSGDGSEFGHTQHGQLVGTPEFMSPEQAEMSALDIDTRSDIYSLGVTLYELLTGVLPFDGHTLRSKAPDEMRRTIREADPPRPSTRLSNLGRGSLSATVRLGMSRESLERTLRGDLDWIVMRAMEKDRARRYQTAAAFRQDIERFLRNEPVEARPPAAAYRLRKFVRRHRVGVAIGAAVAAGLVISAAGLVYGLQSAIRGERIAVEAKAETEWALSESRVVQRFLVKVLEQAQPDQIGNDATVLAAMEQAEQSISDEFADQPAVRAYLNCAIAQVYNSHGRITRSIELFEQNLPVLIDARGLGDFDVISVKNNLALAYEEAGEMERADALFQDAIGFASTLDHPASDELSRTLQINYAGKVLVALGRYDQALATYDELIQGFDKNSVESGLEYHTVRINRAQALERLGRLSDAEVALRAAIDDAESELGSRAPLVLAAMNNVASLCVMTGRIDEAVEIYASLAGTMEDVHGVGSTRASQAWLNHGQLLESSGRHQEALSVYEHAMARSRDRVPATAPVWIHLLARRGVVLSTLERTDDAIVSLTEAIQAIDRSDDGAIRPVWREMVLTFLVDALESTGATEQAATYRELLNDHVAAFGSSSPTAR